MNIFHDIWIHLWYMSAAVFGGTRTQQTWLGDGHFLCGVQSLWSELPESLIRRKKKKKTCDAKCTWDFFKGCVALGVVWGFDEFLVFPSKHVTVTWIARLDLKQLLTRTIKLRGGKIAFFLPNFNWIRKSKWLPGTQSWLWGRWYFASNHASQYVFSKRYTASVD